MKKAFKNNTPGSSNCVNPACRYLFPFATYQDGVTKCLEGAGRNATTMVTQAGDLKKTVAGRKSKLNQRIMSAVI
jgi:hypothetical protein